MLNHLFQKKHIYNKAIACLGLALLLTSCVESNEVSEEPATKTSSNPSEEVVTTEETTASKSTQATPIAETKPTPDTKTVAEPVSSKATPAPSAPKVEVKESPDTDIGTILTGFDQGTQYAIIRPQIIQAGWIPVESPNLSPVDLERELYDAGFAEVAGCAGSGLGQCRFDFEHPDKKQALSIITYGGSELQFGDWNLSSLTAAAPEPGDRNLVQEARSAIPVQFQGLWDISPENCGSNVSDGRLEIGLNQVQFYESTGRPTEILVTGDLEMTTTSEYSGEGSIWTATDTFLLASDYSTITIDDGSVRYRCPS